jgi:hypothetical protein
MLDTFTRADNASSLGTGESGQVYTVRAGIAGITSNEAYFSDTGGGVLGHAVYNSGLSNGYFEVTCDGDQSIGAPSLIFRETDLANFWSWGSDGTTIVCRKRVADTYTVVYTGTRNVQVGDVFKARCDGSLIYLYLNGTKVATVNDSFNSTATNVGIRTSRTTNLFDNLKSSDLESTLSSTLYAASVKTGGAATSANAVGAPNGVYTTDTGGTSWTASWFMNTFSGGTLIGLQNLKLRVKADPNQSNPPTVSTVSVYTPSGAGAWTQHTIGSNFSVSSTTGQDISIDFDGSIFDGVTDFSQVYVEVVTTGSGGSPKSRESVQLDSITWTTKYVAAGNNYTTNPAGTEGLTDSFSHTYSMGSQPADSETLTDNQSFTQSGSRTAIDKEALTDSLSLTGSSTAAVSDSTGLTDSASFLYEAFESPDDSESLSDSFSQSYAMGEEVSDTLGLTDSVSTTESSVVDATETIGVTDSLSTDQQHVVNRFDLSNLSDSLVLNSTNVFEINVDDALGITDEISALIELGESVADQSQNTDELVVVQDGTDTYSDTANLTDGASLSQDTSTAADDVLALSDDLLLVQETTHTLADDSNPSDAATVTLNQVIGLTVPENISDTVSLAAQQIEQFDSSFGSTDELTTVQNYTDIYLENVGLTDTIEVQLNSSGIFDKSDISNQSDELNAAFYMPNGLDDGIALSDAASVALSVAYNLSADLSLTDDLSLLFGAPFVSSDTLGISDSIGTDQAYGVSEGDGIPLSDNLSTIAATESDTPEDLNLTDDIQTGVNTTQDISDTSTISDSLQIEMLVLLEYTAADDSDLADTLSLEQSKGLLTEDALGLDDEVVLQSTESQGPEDEAVLTDSLTLELHTELSLAEDIGLNDLFGILDEFESNDLLGLVDGLSIQQYQTSVDLELFVGSPTVEWRVSLFSAADIATDTVNLIMKMELAETIAAHSLEAKWDLHLQEYTTE